MPQARARGRARPVWLVVWMALACALPCGLHAQQELMVDKEHFFLVFDEMHQGGRWAGGQPGGAALAAVLEVGVGTYLALPWRPTAATAVAAGSARPAVTSSTPLCPLPRAPAAGAGRQPDCDFPVHTRRHRARAHPSDQRNGCCAAAASTSLTGASPPSPSPSVTRSLPRSPRSGEAARSPLRSSARCFATPLWICSVRSSPHRPRCRCTASTGRLQGRGRQGRGRLRQQQRGSRCDFRAAAPRVFDWRAVPREWHARRLNGWLAGRRRCSSGECGRRPPRASPGDGSRRSGGASGFALVAAQRWCQPGAGAAPAGGGGDCSWHKPRRRQQRRVPQPGGGGRGAAATPGGGRRLLSHRIFRRGCSD